MGSRVLLGPPSAIDLASIPGFPNDIAQVFRGSKSTPWGKVGNTQFDSADPLAIASIADPGTGKVVGSVGAGAVAVVPPGTKLDYASITTPVTGITATTEGTAVAVVTGTSVTYDGTEVRIEFFAPTWGITLGPNSITGVLLRDSAVVGQIFQQTDVAASKNPALVGVVYETPAAGAHTYSVKAFVSASTGSIQAGAFGSGVLVPAFLRVTKA